MYDVHEVSYAYNYKFLSVSMLRLLPGNRGRSLTAAVAAEGPVSALSCRNTSGNMATRRTTTVTFNISSRTDLPDWLINQ